MGEVETDASGNLIIIRSHIITYGNAADERITEAIRDEIETMWNEPQGIIYLKKNPFTVNFRITAEYKKQIDEEEIYRNIDARNNYFRIEEFARGKYFIR